MFLSEPPTEAEWAALDKSDHSSRTWAVLLLNGIFCGLVILVMSLRMFTKIVMAAKLSVDDYLMTGSTLLLTAVCIINMHAAHLGFGSHVWDLPGITPASKLATLNTAVSPVGMWNYAALIIIAPSIILSKLSVLSILLRVFPGSMRALRVFLVGLCVLLTLCCVSQALLVAFQCVPMQASWNLLSEDECYVQPLQMVAVGLGAVNVLTDLAICITPIPYFWRLNVSKPQKLCLCAVFMTGLVACIISIVRLSSLRGLDNIDVTYVAVPYFNWSIVEAALIIITGSVPFLRPLLATILPGFFKAHNFTSLFASRKSAFNPREASTAESGFSVAKPFSSAGLTCCSQGDVTITKEFRLEEVDGSSQDGYELRPPGTPRTPLRPVMKGYHSVVTCEKAHV